MWHDLCPSGVVKLLKQFRNWRECGPTLLKQGVRQPECTQAG
jgi:hypothetical protein